MTRVYRHVVLFVVALASALSLASVAVGASNYPTVSKVSPMNVAVGQTLKIRGKYFRPGKKKSTVVFRSESGKTVFAKADSATSTSISIKVPAKLLPYMKTKNGSAVATRFRIRVVGKKLGKKYTSKSKSPLIAPVAGAGAANAKANAGSAGDCDADGIPNSSESDDDNDMLSDSLEASLHTNSCNADTDADGVSDGYEYYAALDYNSVAVPYPGSRPYPNPLDGGDANIDHDGDSLTLYEEYTAWRYTGSPFPLSYSDGTQWTGGKTPVANAAIHGIGSHDMSQPADGFIADWEKDVDNDGLDNFAETHGPLSSPSWWNTIYGAAANNACGAAESPYPVSQFAGTSFVDPDVDGDGIKDGPDDIDHDGYSNQFEAYRPGTYNTAGIFAGENWCSSYVSGPFNTSHSGGPNPDPLARVQPFNPCKPIYSDLCHEVVPVGAYRPDEDWSSPYHGTYP
jgi:hypothetical protein